MNDRDSFSKSRVRGGGSGYSVTPRFELPQGSSLGRFIKGLLGPLTTQLNVAHETYLKGAPNNKNRSEPRTPEI